MTITWTTFALRLLVGFILAMGIGIERQWLKSRAVLKTNVLVTLGAAMFVMLSIMTPGDSSPTRIASQIVSGVGFLGGGVILREGASVRGINTAATLWCSAAIGTLVGSGYLVQAYLSTFAVVGANLLLRPLVAAFRQQRDFVSNDLPPQNNIKRIEGVKTTTLQTSQKSPTTNPPSSPEIIIKPDRYYCDVVCFPETEAKALELIGKFARERRLVLVGMQSKNVPSKIQPGELEVEIKINLASQGSQIDLADYQEIVRLLKTEAQAKLVNWQLSPL